MKGVSTVIATILMLIITIALAGMAYMYIAGVFTSSVQGIEIVDSYCDSGEVAITIRNIGTSPITSLNIKQTSPQDDILAFPFQETIDPGKTITYIDVCEGLTGRSCIYRITPPIGKAATATAFCATKPSSLVLSLHFDEGSGPTAADSSGNGNDGTLYGDTSWVDGKFGKAIYFDGSGNDYVRVADDDSLKPDKITIEAWVKLNSLQDGIIVGKMDYDNDLGYFFKSELTLWYPWLGFGISTWGYFFSPLETNKWIHLALSFDGNSIRVFKDGIKIREESWTGTLTHTNNDLFIGVEYKAGVFQAFLNGAVDEVRIYNKALI